MEIVINKCFGGFTLSKEAQKLLEISTPYPSNKHFGIESNNWDMYRADKRLVAVVKKLGKKANGNCADLTIIEIPDNVNWRVEEYDGNEHISEMHRTWG